jgi:hypothetical protein
MRALQLPPLASLPLFGSRLAPRPSTTHLPARSLKRTTTDHLPALTLVPRPCRPYRSYGLFRHLFEVLIAPFSATNFTTNLIGDFMCSLSQSIADLTYTACIYGTLEAFQVNDTWGRTLTVVPTYATDPRRAGGQVGRAERDVPKPADDLHRRQRKLPPATEIRERAAFLDPADAGMEIPI